MKHLFTTALLIAVLSLTSCSDSHKTDHSVTVGKVNWRTSVIDSAATDSVNAIGSGDSTTQIVLLKPDVKILKINPFSSISDYIHYYGEAKDTLVARDSIARLYPEKTDSVRDKLSSKDINAYISQKMGVESAQSILGSSILILAAAIFLIGFLALKIYKVFIKSPFDE